MKIIICDLCNQEIKFDKVTKFETHNSLLELDVCELCLQNIKNVKNADTSILKAEALKRWANRL